MKSFAKVILFSILFIVVLNINTKISMSREMMVERVEGSDRYKTAVEVSKFSFYASPQAIIATGEDYPDALVGGSLSVQLHIPILLTRKNSITIEVLEELERLGVEEVYILGGEAAVSKAVENEIKKISRVRRVAGRNRYETAEEINFLRYDLRPNQEIFAMGDGVIYVSGADFPDALCAAPYIGQLGGDMLVYLGLLRPGIDAAPFTVIGGKSVIKNSYDDEFIPYIGEGGYLEEIRIAGKNRNGTAVEVAKRYPINARINISTIVITNGMNYPDALSAAGLVGAVDGALLLTSPNKLSPETKQYLEETYIDRIIVVGGKSAVSEQVLDELREIKVEVSY